MQRSRRDFLKSTTAAGLGFWVGGCSLYKPSRSPNEKLNIGKIGAGGKGGGDTHGVKSENIVALCDVDLKYAAATIKSFPQAKLYHDYREMLDKEKLDAVVISTPDHMHAPASLAAMRMGLHVYVQKPMSHTVEETRWMRDAAKRYKVVTQMGNQGTANDTMRRAVELVQSGAIGEVREAHVWTNRPTWPQGGQHQLPGMIVPENLKWELWLGVAPQRDYHENYHPFRWRGWWDFGQGALGDMGCHNLNLPYWALQLDHPTSIEAESRGLSDEMAPLASHIRYEFAARGDLPPVTLHWYDGDNLPPEGLFDELPPEKPLSKNGNGVLLVGSQGKLFSPSSHCRLYELWPKEKFVEYVGPKPTLPRSPGHYNEWILGCKGGPAPLSNFDYAARLTETVLLGNVAIRAGQRLEWDAKKGQVTNYTVANQYLSKEYREGWL